LLWETIWLIPTVMVFLLHSLGHNFVDLLNGLSASTIWLLVLLIIFSCAVCFLDLLLWYFIYYTLKMRWELEVAQSRETFAVEEKQGLREGPVSQHFYVFSSKLLSFAFISSSLFLAALYLATVIVTGNEGAWTAFVLYCLATFFQLIFALSILLRTHRTFAWYLKFRVFTGIHLLASYFFCWINLTLLVLQGQYKSGFWEEVDSQPLEKKAVIWLGLTSYALVVVVAVWNIYLHKFSTGQQWAAGGGKDNEEQSTPGLETSSFPMEVLGSSAEELGVEMVER